MLRILEQKNLSAYQEIVSQCSLSEEVQMHLSEAIDDNDVVKGWILYSYQPEKVILYAMNDGGDWNYCDGLIRSVLFKAELKGIEQAEFLERNPEIRTRIEKLGFVKNNQNLLEKISEVMENCQKCKENPVNT